MGQQRESVVSGVDELIRKTEAVKEFLEELARITRDQRERSYRFFAASKVIGKAINEIKKQVPQEMELEGGGHSWWYVCPECHGEIDDSDHYCRHCGQAVTNQEGKAHE